MGQYKITEMSPEEALQVLDWHYDPPYHFYNIRSKAEAMQEFLMGSYYAVYFQETLNGVFCIGQSAQVPEGIEAGVYKDALVDVGLGMSPAFTGQGQGSAFFQCILSHLHTRFPDAGIRLSVAAFNKRAIKLYTNCGFKEQSRFFAKSIEFIVMTREYRGKSS